jgi:hypothetical protein
MENSKTLELAIYIHSSSTPHKIYLDHAKKPNRKIIKRNHFKLKN